MLEVSGILHYKTYIKITNNEDSLPSLWMAGLRFVFEQICQLIGYEGTFEEFQKVKYYETDDHSRKLLIATIVKDSEQAWAAKIRFYDSVLRRRNWYFHIGMRQTNDDDTCLYLYYAEYYTDYLAGSLNSLPPPQKISPRFVRTLISDTRFDCLADGYQLPTFAIELNTTILSAFYHLLDSDDRKQPIILLACTDCIDSAYLADALLGNALVFFTYDCSLISRINAYLPESLQVRFDAVHVYQLKNEGSIKMNAFNGEDVYRMGEQVFCASLRRAYCECFWPYEKKECFTYDDIVRLQMNEALRLVREQNAYLTEKINAAVRKTSSTVSLRQSLEKSREEYEACEELMSETAQKLDDLRQAVRSIADALYLEDGFAKLMPSIFEDECLALLLGAINCRLNPYGRLKAKMPAATST